jgi:hypothetical protein
MKDEYTTEEIIEALSDITAEDVMNHISKEEMQLNH